MEGTISEHDGNINAITVGHYAQYGSSAYQAAGISQEIIEKCYEFTRALACNSVYQYCDVSSTPDSPVARPICKHTCALLQEGGPCGFFLDPAFLTEQRLQLTELRLSLFSRCDNRTAPGGTTPECVSLSVNSPAVGQFGSHTLLSFSQTFMH